METHAFRMSEKKTALSKKKTHTKQQLSIFPSYLIKDPAASSGILVTSLPSVGHFCRPFTVKTPQKNGTGCANVIPSPATIFRLPSGQASPRHPASVRTCSMWFPVHFRFLAHSLTTFGRWGCGERCHLSYVVGDSAVILSGMSRQIAPQTRSEALRRTKRVLNAPQGMEGAKRLQRVLGGQARRYLTRGVQVARNRASPCKAHLHGTGSYSAGWWS